MDLARELAGAAGGDAVAPENERARYGADESGAEPGLPDVVVRPADTAGVAAVLAVAHARGVPVVPMGARTGLSGGAVPRGGGIALSLERLDPIGPVDGANLRITAGAGARTASVQEAARGAGLFYPPDPASLERSTIGGNIATNAGGPRCFKYGVTAEYVLALEAVTADGRVFRTGAATRKNATGPRLAQLLVGSEGTLAVITEATLRLVPAPEAAYPVAGFYSSTAAGCAAIERVVGSGLEPAALEYLDAGALAAAGGAFPGGVPAGAGFLVVAEADGTREEAARLRAELVEVLGANALAVVSPEPAELWRWREGVAFAVISLRGGKSGEDVVVPLDRLAEAIEETVEIGRRHGLEACSWGHAGDGNVHSNFVVDPHDEAELERARAGAEGLFAMAIRLGGSISGEHGIGWTKRGWLERQWGPRAVELHRALKQVFDPKGLLNPGKKT